MDDSRGAGIVALLVVIAICVTVFYLQVGEPTATVVEFLFPRM
jgi:hypothetical protein